MNEDNWESGKIVLGVNVIEAYQKVIEKLMTVFCLDFNTSVLESKRIYLEVLLNAINTIDNYNSLRKYEKEFSFYKEKLSCS